ncbi:TIGR02391 family protein [Thermus tenuipuniceus]|uniref:TIGR02391 family protein n=1 Tax=Thermus tenuipuniceus TaxID=2078690 RepID=UPI000CF96831|nr:TIGR02391 family protein [Thermus tenuipuniceus]
MPADEWDVIGLLWWAEKYQGDKKQAWERFSSIAERIALEPENALDTQRILREPEIAMLYEALVAETKHPEPALLFDYFPFHPRIREVARDHFINQKCVAAVFEATKALNELIQNVSGVNDKNEAELVQATMKQISDPSKLKIRFNDFLNEDSGKNEQAGLAAICEGIFKAFRNPKGHKAETHPLVQLEPYEALQQLITINYMMIRVERATAPKNLEEHGYGG